MQKLIGSILVLTATAGAGYLYGEGLKDYLRQMEYLRYIAGMIRGQLEYTGAPLQELLMDVSVKIKEPYKSWLEHTARRAAKRTDADFTEIWMRGKGSWSYRTEERAPGVDQRFWSIFRTGRS